MKKYTLGIITGLIISAVLVTAAALYNASDINYTNPNGVSTNVQSAIDELYNHYNSISSIKLNITTVDDDSSLPTENIKDNDIIFVPYTEYNNRYLISKDAPSDPTDGTLWINFNYINPITFNIDESKLPLGIAYQYQNGEWLTVKAYIYHDEWQIFSDGYNNWKILSTIIGKDYTEYSSLNDFMNEKENSSLMFSIDDAITYLINSTNLIQDMKKTDKYSTNFVPYALSYSGLTNKQKYSYGLPFYVLNGTSEFTIATTAGCNLTPGASSTSYTTSGSWGIQWIGSTNCCGGRILYTKETFDYSKYIKIYANVTSFSRTYSSSYGYIGYYVSGNRPDYMYLGISSTGLQSQDISSYTFTQNVALTSYTCSNENNTTTGDKINVYVNQIYFE